MRRREGRREAFLIPPASPPRVFEACESRGGPWQRFELPGAAEARPVGNVRLGPAVEENAKKAAGLLSGPASDLVSEVLQQSYRADETYGSAFGKLFARLFAEQGLILLDPLDAAYEMRRRCRSRRWELNVGLRRSAEVVPAHTPPDAVVGAALSGKEEGVRGRAGGCQRQPDAASTGLHRQSRCTLQHQTRERRIGTLRQFLRFGPEAAAWSPLALARAGNRVSLVEEAVSASLRSRFISEWM